jgi:cytochrome P450
VNAVIEETLRLYGAAPGGLRSMVPKDGVELENFFLVAPAGQKCEIMI